MKTLVRSAAVAALVLLAAPAHAQRGDFDTARLRPFTAEYEILAQGNAFGRSVNTLARDGDGWKFRMEGTFGAVRQTIDAAWGPRWEPGAYGETYAGPFEGRADVRVENGRVTGSSAMPAQAGGDKTFDVAAVPGLAWSQMEEAMLSTAELAPGRSIVIPFFNTSTGAVEPVTFAVGALESVTVPAGTFQSYRVQVSGGSSALVMWLRAEGPHVLVKQEIVGRPVVVQLKSIR
ncbi:MAG TPA: hypothetical protein VGC13_21310 [Longimicrobium sp.]|jgi:hypothetical protein|uniref:DUF3108 domain-containing protein n=1 Tax=Longimicrobium sp. TaxID=2029185 RepID=UPI002ED8B597